MLFYSDRVPVTYGVDKKFDAKFFAEGTNTDVIVRDAAGKPVKNADGSFKTVKGELRDLLVPMAGEIAQTLPARSRDQSTDLRRAGERMGQCAQSALAGA